MHHRAALALALVTLCLGCSAEFALGGPNEVCGGGLMPACFDPCTNNGVSPTCTEQGWECPAWTGHCEEECLVDVACVDACGNDIAGDCVNGIYTCPDNGGVICDEEGGRAAWESYYGTEAYQSGRSVAVDADGNVIVAGTFQGTLSTSWNTVASMGGYDTFIAKHAPDGTPLWMRVRGGLGDERPSGLGVDANGNIVVAIGVTDEASQPAQPGPMTLVVLSPDGVTQLERGYDFAVGGALNMLAVEPDGDLTIVGSHAGEAVLGGPILPSFGENDIFVARLDAAGDVMWVRSMGGPGFDHVQDVAVDDAGNVFVVGSFQETMNVAGLELASAGSFDGFVASYDDTGNVVFARAVGSEASDLCARVAAAGDGGVAFTGHFGAGLSVGGIELATDSSTGGAYAARLDARGVITQVHQLPGSGSGEFMSQDQFSVAVDAQGFLVVGGQFEGTSSLVSPNVSEDVDMMLMRFDPTGGLDWGYSFGGHSTERVTDLATGPNSEIAVVGEYWSGVDLGNGALPSFIEGAIFLGLFDSSGGGSE